MLPFCFVCKVSMVPQLLISLVAHLPQLLFYTYGHNVKSPCAHISSPCKICSWKSSEMKRFDYIPSKAIRVFPSLQKCNGDFIFKIQTHINFFSCSRFKQVQLSAGKGGMVQVLPLKSSVDSKRTPATAEAHFSCLSQLGSEVKDQF